MQCKSCDFNLHQAYRLYAAGRKSLDKYVLSGSILGPIIFVLFINDMPWGIDTKIRRKITSNED